MDIIWQQFVQQLLLALIPAIVALVVGLLSKWSVEIWSRIKKEQPDIAWYLSEAASLAVNAAEQMDLSGKLSDYANTKLDYAIEVAQLYLAEKGVRYIDLGLLRAAIEAEVKRAEFPHLASAKPSKTSV